MSEPLSIAGSAVGIISLGIQVCQGLAEYLNSIKGRNQEIKESLSDVQTLRVAFQSLSTIIGKFKAEDAAQIHRCLQDGETTLNALQSLLTKLISPMPTATNDIKSKMKDSGRALIYPFRQGELKTLRGMLDQLLRTLNLMLQITDIKRGVSHEDKIDELKASIDAITTDHKNIESLEIQTTTQTNTLMDFRQTLMSTNTATQNIVAKMQAYDRDMLDMKSALMKQTTKLESIEAFMLKDMTMQRPASLSIMDPNASSPTAGSQNKIWNSALVAFPEQCDCPTSIHPSKHTFRRFGRFTIHGSNHDKSGHLPRCQFFIGHRMERTISTRFLVQVGTYFNGHIEAGMAYMPGHGLSNLSFWYKFKNVVHESPVTREFQNIEQWMKIEERTSEALVRRLKLTESTIYTMYREGKASPTELVEVYCGYENGWSHADLFCNLLREMTYSTSIDSTVAEVALQILKGLVGVGAPINWSLIQATILHDTIMAKQSTNTRIDTSEHRLVSFIGKSIEPRFELMDNFTYYPHIYNLSSFLSMSPDVIGEYTNFPIFQAILVRSLPDLENAIQRFPQSVRAKCGTLTILHLSASWAAGLERLLKTEAIGMLNSSTDQCSEDWRETPLHAAARANSPEAMKVLLEANCDIYSNGTVRDLELILTITDKEPRYAAVIASNLAERRRKLRLLACEKVPSYSRISCDVPDRDARAIYEALIEVELPQPSWLTIPPDSTSVFHMEALPLKYFPIFAEEGFEDYNSRNLYGYTPIMICRSQTFVFVDPDFAIFEVIPWLIENCCLDSTLEDHDNHEVHDILKSNIYATGWHYFASMIGGKFANDLHFRPDVYRLLSNMQSLVKIISQITIKDRCTCWCNLDGRGCSPLMSLVKSYFNRYDLADHCKNWWNDPTLNMRHILLHTLSNTQSMGKTVSNEPSTSLLDVVRLLTFEALEMKHTCCKVAHLCEYGVPCLYEEAKRSFENCHSPTVIVALDQEEVHQIRTDPDEKRLALNLHDLMNEFTEEMKKIDCSPSAFESFLRGYWRCRMFEFFSPNQEVVVDMGAILENVETYVTPGPLRDLLGDEFTFEINPMKDKLYHDRRTQKIKDMRSNKSLFENDPEKVYTLDHCYFCDQPDSNEIDRIVDDLRTDYRMWIYDWK